MRTLILTTALLSAVACDNEGENSELAVLEIIGSYTDGFGGTHDITEATWTQGGFGDPSVFHIETFENGSDYLIAENDAANAFSAGLWSRFDWTIVDGATWFCQTTFDAADAEAAMAVPAADSTDLEGEGCGGFAWSELTPAE